MKICWVNDYNFAGGAEITNKHVLELLAKDHLIQELSPDTYLFPNEDTDLIVVNNFRRFSLRVIKRFLDIPFIYFPHDVLSMSDGHEKFARKLLQKSKVNIFLSPLHENKIYEKYGLLDKEIYAKSFIYMPYFDVDKYRNNMGGDGIVWVGSMEQHKGIDNVLNFARKHKAVIDFYGKGSLRIVGQIHHSKYARLQENWNGQVYSKYKYFIHLPEEVEALGRCVVEAMLSGCICINNENIGFKSWGIQDREEFIRIMNIKQEQIMEVITQ